jgi:phosphomannomutase
VKEGALRRATAGLNSIGRFKVLESGTLDGVKFYLDTPRPNNGAEAWVLMRASGTEPLMRIYAEASTPEMVTEILASAVAFVHEKADSAGSGPVSH